jgi:hypothetical protein
VPKGNLRGVLRLFDLALVRLTQVATSQSEPSITDSPLFSVMRSGSGFGGGGTGGFGVSPLTAVSLSAHALSSRTLVTGSGGAGGGGGGGLSPRTLVSGSEPVEACWRAQTTPRSVLLTMRHLRIRTLALTRSVESKGWRLPFDTGLTRVPRGPTRL